ncbi:MAG: cytochrome c biogenesis protein CcsA [Verrucomicrobiales bacterium]
MNSRLFPTSFLLALLCLPVLSLGREAPETALPNYEPWDESVVETFETILVQDDGRVKPISTFARFTLLQFSGKTTLTFATQDGESHKLPYSDWLLDVLFRGDVAKDLPVFVVDDSAAVVQIGVSPKSKRDRYSYNELSEGRAKLAELSAQYAEKQQKFEQSDKDPQFELGRIEGMILTLGRNISTFEYLLGQLGFARKGELIVNENVLPEELRQLGRRLDPVEMLDRMPEMSLDQLVQMVRQPVGESEEEQMFSGALKLFFFHANSARGVSLFPPQDEEDEVWLSAGDVMLAGLASKEVRPWATENLASVQALVEAEKEDQAAFQAALENFADQQRAEAESRGEGTHAEMEVNLYHGKYFSNALVLFVLAFVILAVSWFAPGSKFGRIMVLIASLLALAGLALDVYGITLRSIIRQRPPITNLYDTVLFITGIAVLLGLLLEYFTRIGVGALIAVVSGMLGMFLSMKYEAKEATDTIGQLVAVLDTNFWLATHVTIINIGYAAGLVAALIGMLYLAARFVSTLRGRRNKDFFGTLTRMNYGVICFCLFFSLVGTVLGGIWANYSWGRFWGWDPKENGALMICLWTLVILHGRMSGWIREIGTHMNSVVLGIIVTFSWWGVNNLGVGLHSYGFTEGVWGTLYSAWIVMGAFMAMGIVVWFVERKRKSDKRASASADPVTA